MRESAVRREINFWHPEVQYEKNKKTNNWAAQLLHRSDHGDRELHDDGGGFDVQLPALVVIES